jgi:DNA invertase Pin-like site-specific DNA recombinase
LHVLRPPSNPVHGTQAAESGLADLGVRFPPDENPRASLSAGVLVKRTVFYLRVSTLDQFMADARRGWFDVLLVWSCDRLARSTEHFLEVLDELHRLNVEFMSFHENLDSGGPLGPAIVVIISAIAELERSPIVERVKAGLSRAKRDGRHIGRPALQVDHAAILQDRAHGRSLRQIAKNHHISRATVCRVLLEIHQTRSKTPQNISTGSRDFTAAENAS